MTGDPKIEIVLDRPTRNYQPEEELIATFQISGMSASELQAVEASVLWYTEGTGEEDLATHDFRRLLPVDKNDTDLLRQRRFQTRLPRSPLSYQGLIVKIRWAVRVRLFLQQGKEFVEEVPFRLGNLAPVASNAAGRSTKRRTSGKQSDDAA